ncbi:MAG: hypothetical protein ACRCTZ_01945 [Sarcina sp.]
MFNSIKVTFRFYQADIKKFKKLSKIYNLNQAQMFRKILISFFELDTILKMHQAEIAKLKKDSEYRESLLEDIIKSNILSKK